MTEINQERHTSVTFAGAVLNLYRLVCAIVDDQVEEDRILNPFPLVSLVRDVDKSWRAHAKAGSIGILLRHLLQVD